MYSVVRDTREGQGQGWFFSESSSCEGTLRYKLDTGDYSIVGLENVFTIERKGTTGEFAHNIVEARFDRELERLKEFKYAFVILEFTYQDILDFPKNSGIPEKKWKYLKIRPKFILKRLLEFRLKYPTIHFLLTGDEGKRVATQIIKVVYGASKKELGS